MSPARPPHPHNQPSFPRVSGDEPALKAFTEKVLAFSPRVRG